MRIEKVGQDSRYQRLARPGTGLGIAHKISHRPSGGSAYLLVAYEIIPSLATRALRCGGPSDANVVTAGHGVKPRFLLRSDTPKHRAGDLGASRPLSSEVETSNRIAADHAQTKKGDVRDLVTRDGPEALFHSFAI